MGKRAMSTVWATLMGLLSMVSAPAEEASRSMHTIRNNRIRLEAQLVVPNGGAEVKPVVVFAGGSSTSDFRDYSEGFTETLIEGIFLPRDFAILYFNKRGIGKSTGNWKWSSIESRASDVLAAVDYLRTLPIVDGGHVGLVGHSQGGWVVQLAGSQNPRISFVISLAGPTVTVREQDLKTVELRLACEGFREEELAKRLRQRDRAHDRMMAIGGIFPFFELRFMRNILPYDPKQSLRGLTQPTLLAFAGFDSMVPVDQNWPRFQQIFPDGTPENITWHTAPAADHLFRTTDTVCFDYSGASRPPYADRFVEYLAAWIGEHAVPE